MGKNRNICHTTREYNGNGLCKITKSLIKTKIGF